MIQIDFKSFLVESEVTTSYDSSDYGAWIDVPKRKVYRIKKAMDHTKIAIDIKGYKTHIPTETIYQDMISKGYARITYPVSKFNNRVSLSPDDWTINVRHDLKGKLWKMISKVVMQNDEVSVALALSNKDGSDLSYQVFDLNTEKSKLARHMQ